MFGRTKRAIVWLAGSILLICPLAAEPPSRAADPWQTTASGIRRADALIAQCLIDAGDSRIDSQFACIDVADDTCGREHGTSQHEMNDCAAASAGAWEARIARAMRRLGSAKPSQSRLNARIGEAYRALVASQQRWSAWNTSDCKTKAIGSEHGTMWAYEIELCMSRHNALRAIELERLINWWLS